MDETNTDLKENTVTAGSEPRTEAPGPGDLDDLIFRGEGWLISDR